MRPTIASLVVTIALLAVASPAVAASGTFELPRLPGSTLAALTIGDLVGPLPAGDALAFAAGNAVRGWSVRVGAPGAAGRVLAAYPPLQNASIAVRASATRVAVVRHAWVCDDCKYMSYRATLDAVAAGPLGGPLTVLSQCETGQPCAGAGALCGGDRPQFAAALGGDLLAVRDSCSRETSVVDLATGATRPVTSGLAFGTPALAVAGRYVATTESSVGTLRATVVVRDATTGAQVYRAGLPATDVVPAPQLVLLADATAIYTSPVPGQLALVVASPAAPAGRVVRLVPYSTVIDGAGPTLVLITAPGIPLGFVSLDGRAVPPVPGGATNLLGAPVFDGATVAWAQRTCVTTVLTRWQIADPPPQRPDLRCPTPRPSRATLTLSRCGRLRVSLACPATTRGGCLATARFVARRLGPLPRGANGAERLYRLGAVPVALDPGEHALADLAVPAGAAHWVRRHAPLRVRIDVVSDRTSAVERPPGDRGVVTRTVTLRAAR